MSRALPPRPVTEIPALPGLVGAAYGLAAAALFGASAPFAKLLLGRSGPVMISALLYLGAAAGLACARLLRRSRTGASPEARLRRADLPLIAAITVIGGIIGPVLMLTGLNRISALTGSLLLNLEAPFTVMLAVALFGEYLGPRAVGAAILTMLGAVLLSYQPGEIRADMIGCAAIAAACLGWGIDNNLSRELSVRDPLQTVQVKTLGAGVCTLIIALGWGESLPDGEVLAAALFLGSLCYGLSLVLDMRALRRLGAAREAAYFSTAPFIGAVISVPLFGKWPAPADLLAAALMACGVGLLLGERHSHVHTHEAIEHDHLHVHDEHHRHDHPLGVTGPHSHLHWHEPITHQHPHLPDLHHRHRHT